MCLFGVLGIAAITLCVCTFKATFGLCHVHCAFGYCTDSRPDICKCLEGFEGDRCKYDVDECAGRHGCKHNCVNYFGGYRCTCRSGYSDNGSLYNCYDINECSEGSHRCNHTCHNTIGSYYCACRNGYRLQGSYSCLDIDECASNNGGCSQVCSNIPGSYRCSCNVGYALQADSRSCRDYDECSTSNHGCEQKCNNLPGSYNCSCNVGYVIAADRKLCNDVDECSDGTHACVHNCHNARGSYTCSCRKGYELASDVRRCRDINECSRGTAGCGQNCINTDGSFYCTCQTGWHLSADKRACLVTIPFAFTSCPVDLQRHTASNTSRVTWPIPEVADYPGNITVKGNIHPGYVFPVGTTVVTYTAEDTTGNKTTCNFSVEVKRILKECREDIPVPDRGTLRCWQPAVGGGQRCDVACLSGPRNIAQNPDVPHNYVCNSEGTWQPSIQWGVIKTLACLVLGPPNSYRLVFNLKLSGTCVDDAYFKPYVKGELIKWLQVADMCPKADFIKLCHLSQVKVICREEDRKRRNSHEVDLIVNLSLYATFTERSRTDEYQKALALTENLTNFINSGQLRFEYGGRKYTFDTGSPGEEETTCSEGQMKVLGKYCAKCPPGAKYNYVSKACDPCPEDTYQERQGQSECIKCNGDKKSLPGSFSRYDCQNTTQLKLETAVEIPLMIGVTFAVIVTVVLTAISAFFVCRRYRNRDRRPATERSPAPAVTQGQDYDNVAYENAEVQTASKHRTEKNRDGRQHTGPWTVQTDTTNASNPDQPYEGIMIRDVTEQKPYSQLILRGDVPIPTDI